MADTEARIDSEARLLDWDSPDDPGNPRNWSPSRKAFHAACIAGAAFTTAFASSVFTPAIEVAAVDLGAPVELSLLAYSIYVLGLALGAPFAAPLSETIGRRYVYWFSTPLFIAFTLGSGFSNDIAALVIQRLLAALFGSCSLAIGSSTIADLWSPEQRTWPMAIYVLIPFLAPSIAPLVGAAATQYLSWRWTAWMVLFVGILTFFLIAPFMRETYKNAILETRAKQRGVRGPLGGSNGPSLAQQVLAFVRRGINRPVHMYLTEPVVTAFVSYVAFSFALLYAFFAAFQPVYQQYYGFGFVQVGLTFLGIGVGSVLGMALVLLFDRFHYKPMLRKVSSPTKSKNTTSVLPPEHRLPIAMFGGVCVPCGLFLFGWSVDGRLHWIAPVIGETLFGGGNVLIFMGATQYLMDTYGPLYGASAQGASTLVRYLLGFSFPLFALQMFNGLGVQWACTLLGCLSLVGMCIPFALYRWGPALRARTKYAR